MKALLVLLITFTSLNVLALDSQRAIKNESLFLYGEATYGIQEAKYIMQIVQAGIAKTTATSCASIPTTGSSTVNISWVGDWDNNSTATGTSVSVLLEYDNAVKFTPAGFNTDGSNVNFDKRIKLSVNGSFSALVEFSCTRSSGYLLQTAKSNTSLAEIIWDMTSQSDVAVDMNMINNDIGGGADELSYKLKFRKTSSTNFSMEAVARHVKEVGGTVTPQGIFLNATDHTADTVDSYISVKGNTAYSRVGITYNSSLGTGIVADSQICLAAGTYQGLNNMSACDASSGTGADVGTNGAVYALNQIGIGNGYVFSSIDTLNLFNLW